jgi:hypothetical protein
LISLYLGKPDLPDGLVNNISAKFAAFSSNIFGLASANDSEVLYISDRDNHIVRKFNKKTGFVTYFAGNGQAGL